MRRAVVKAFVWPVALAGLLPAATSHAAEPLRLCVATDNLPMSDDAPPRGMEVKFGRELAERMGRTLELVWHSPGAGAADRALLTRQCNAALGAVASGDALTQAQPIPGITLTRPYYTAGYMLVRRVQTPPVRQLADLDEERIAVEMVSIPMYTLKQRGLRVFAVDDHAAVIDAVADGRANYGYLWGPIAEWDLRDRDDVVIERQFKPEERWDFAMAVRADDQRLKEEIDSALVALDRSGELAKLFVPDAF